MWEQDHVERGVSALAARARPALWFSNLLVTDAGLRPIGRHDLVRGGRSPMRWWRTSPSAAPCCSMVSPSSCSAHRYLSTSSCTARGATSSCQRWARSSIPIADCPAPTARRQRRRRRPRAQIPLVAAGAEGMVGGLRRKLLPPGGRAAAAARDRLPEDVRRELDPSSHRALRPGCATPSVAKHTASILSKRSAYGRCTPSAEPRHGKGVEVQPFQDLALSTAAQRPPNREPFVVRRALADPGSVCLYLAFATRKCTQCPLSTPRSSRQCRPSRRLDRRCPSKRLSPCRTPGTCPDRPLFLLVVSLLLPDLARDVVPAHTQRATVPSAAGIWCRR